MTAAPRLSLRCPCRRVSNFLRAACVQLLWEELLMWIPFACTVLLPAPTPLCICSSGRLQRLQKHIQIPRFSDELEHAIYLWTRQTSC